MSRIVCSNPEESCPSLVARSNDLNRFRSCFPSLSFASSCGVGGVREVKWSSIVEYVVVTRNENNGGIQYGSSKEGDIMR